MKEVLTEDSPEPLWPNLHPSSYDDDLHVWLCEYFLTTWGVTISQMEKEVDPDWDGEYTATFQTLDWLYPMTCEDVLQWYGQKKKLEALV